MECEICGRYMEKGKRVRVENTVVVTCDDCSGYGNVVSEVQVKVRKRDTNIQKPFSAPDIDLELGDNEGTLIEDYYSVIQKSREKLGLKQEELAKAINEPVSLIHRIESGRIKPSTEVARKIQKRLKIRLFERSDRSNELVKAKTNIGEGELTLGDLVVVKKRG